MVPGRDFGFKSLGKHVSISMKFIYIPVSTDLAAVTGTKFILRSMIQLYALVWSVTLLRLFGIRGLWVKDV